MPDGTTQSDMRLPVINSEGELRDAIIVPAGGVATFAHLPDSRKDWQGLLLEYVADIESLTPFGGHSTDPDILARRPGV